MIDLFMQKTLTMRDQLQKMKERFNNSRSHFLSDRSYEQQDAQSHFSQSQSWERVLPPQSQHSNTPTKNIRAKIEAIDTHTGDHDNCKLCQEHQDKMVQRQMLQAVNTLRQENAHFKAELLRLGKMVEGQENLKAEIDYLKSVIKDEQVIINQNKYVINRESSDCDCEDVDCKFCLQNPKKSNIQVQRDSLAKDTGGLQIQRLNMNEVQSQNGIPKVIEIQQGSDINDTKDVKVMSRDRQQSILQKKLEILQQKERQLELMKEREKQRNILQERSQLEILQGKEKQQEAYKKGKQKKNKQKKINQKKIKQQEMNKKEQKYKQIDPKQEISKRKQKKRDTDRQIQINQEGTYSKDNQYQSPRRQLHRQKSYGNQNSAMLIKTDQFSAEKSQHGRLKLPGPVNVRIIKERRPSSAHHEITRREFRTELSKSVQRPRKLSIGYNQLNYGLKAQSMNEKTLQSQPDQHFKAVHGSNPKPIQPITQYKPDYSSGGYNHSPHSNRHAFISIQGWDLERSRERVCCEDCRERSHRDGAGHEHRHRHGAGHGVGHGVGAGYGVGYNTGNGIGHGYGYGRGRYDYGFDPMADSFMRGYQTSAYRPKPVAVGQCHLVHQCCGSPCVNSRIGGLMRPSDRYMYRR